MCSNVAWTPTFYKISVVFFRRKERIQVWNDIWYIFILQVNKILNSFSYNALIIVYILASLASLFSPKSYFHISV